MKLTISKYAKFHYKCMSRFFPFSYGYSSCRLIFQLGIKCMTLLKSAWTGLSEKVLPFYSSWLFLKTMGGLIKSMHFFGATLYQCKWAMENKFKRKIVIFIEYVCFYQKTASTSHERPWKTGYSFKVFLKVYLEISKTREAILINHKMNLGNCFQDCPPLLGIFWWVLTIFPLLIFDTWFICETYLTFV